MVTIQILNEDAFLKTQGEGRETRCSLFAYNDFRESWLVPRKRLITFSPLLLLLSYSKDVFLIKLVNVVNVIHVNQWIIVANLLSWILEIV